MATQIYACLEAQRTAGEKKNPVRAEARNGPWSWSKPGPMAHLPPCACSQVRPRAAPALRCQASLETLGVPSGPWGWGGGHRGSQALAPPGRGCTWWRSRHVSLTPQSGLERALEVPELGLGWDSPFVFPRLSDPGACRQPAPPVFATCWVWANQVSIPPVRPHPLPWPNTSECLCLKNSMLPPGAGRARRQTRKTADSSSRGTLDTSFHPRTEHFLPLDRPMPAAAHTG